MDKKEKYLTYDMDELLEASESIVEEYKSWMEKIFDDPMTYADKVFMVQRRIKTIKDYIEIFRIEQMIYSMNPTSDFVPNVELLDESKKCIDEIRELIKD